ncbi:MAG TPA: hypothetical protein VFU89_00825 [Rhabdochlamydiaceae bacterium]|nr:hypothetical protein [Rhabdochlamydiaceae bacterium]
MTHSHVSLRIPFNRVVATNLQDIRATLYSHIKKIDQVIPKVLDLLLKCSLEDLKKESTLDSRSIAQVEVGINGDVQIGQERVAIDKEISLKQSRECLLLSLRPEDEITAIEAQIRAEAQKIVETPPTEPDTSEEYRLLHDYLLKENFSYVGQVLGIAETGPFPSSDEIDRRLAQKIEEHPALAYDMYTHVKNGGKSTLCQKFYDTIVNRRLDYKSYKDRAKDLERLFKKAADSLASQISNNVNIGILSGNTLVRVTLDRISFKVTVDDGSSFASAKVLFLPDETN